VSGYRHSDTKCNCPRVADCFIKLDLASEDEIYNLVTLEHEHLFAYLNPDRNIRNCTWCILKCFISRKLTSNLWDI
jgi:hypothetical protein